MSEARKLLIVEDDSGLRSQLRWALDDFDVATAEDRPAAMTSIRKDPVKVVVLDLGLPPDPNGASEGLAALQEILSLHPSTKVIIASGNEDRRHALQAISYGAYDFYPKPVDIDVLRLIIERAMYLAELEEQSREFELAHQQSPFANVQTQSPAMLEVCRLVERVATSDVSILITGESGTGKEIIARALHEASHRAKGPMVAINCAAIPGELLESELFGHEKGAFTGAHKRSIGKFEHADGGTLFLDEIGDMPLPLQAKLLRFVQERMVEPVGGRGGKKVDVRIVSATNRDLRAFIEEEKFREDLYYRLDEMTVALPPLRERKGDAGLLAKFFLRQYGQENRKISGFSPDALALIDSYDWPGNVRELENRIKRAVILADGNQITAQDLSITADDDEAAIFPTLRQVREKAEADIILRALQLTDHNVSQAAKLLGVSRPTLYDLMKTLGVKQQRKAG